MPSLRQRKGKIGEDIAQRFLESQGYCLQERSWHSRYGEIDLIMWDRDELVFVEVKMRTNNICGHPEEMVSYRKMRRLKKTARQYLEQMKPNSFFWRHDIVAITGNALSYDIRHFRDTIRDG